IADSYKLTGGTITLAGSGGLVTVAPNATATIDSKLSGTAGLTLAASNGLTAGDMQSGGGILVLTGSNALNGTIFVQAGILRVSSFANLNSNNSLNNVVLGSATSSGTFDYTGVSGSYSGQFLFSVVGNPSTVNIANAGAVLSMTQATSGPYRITGQGVFALPR